MGKSTVRVLVVDDFEPFRQFICSTLQNIPDLQVIGEVSSGLEAVRRAEELQPDLIVLDLGLPGMNGIEVARRIPKLSAHSRILFVSQESSADSVKEALSAGARGYVVKSDAGRELLIAVRAILRGETFLGARFAGTEFGLALQKPMVHRRHEVGFYSDDTTLLASFTEFIAAELKAGHALIVVATEFHRARLQSRLRAHGLDIGTAMEQGSYTALDVDETLSKFMVEGLPDPVLFSQVVGDLVVTASKAATADRPRVAFCGECAPFLWKQGNAEAAIRLEKLWDDMAKSQGLDILCGYLLETFQTEQDSHVFQAICAEHSSVHSW